MPRKCVQPKRPTKTLVVAKDPANPPPAIEITKIQKFLDSGEPGFVTSASVEIFQLIDGVWRKALTN